jgi:hypothetical protein
MTAEIFLKETPSTFQKLLTMVDNGGAANCKQHVNLFFFCMTTEIFLKETPSTFQKLLTTADNGGQKRMHSQPE